MKRIISVIFLASVAVLTAVNAETIGMAWEFDKDTEKFPANKSTLSFKDGNLVQTVSVDKNNTRLLSTSRE